MRVCSLGSGSGGNCIALEACGQLLLIDCGLSYRELKKRMAAVGLPVESVSGVFFTHDHGDHCRGLATFHKHNPQAALFANGNTADAISTMCGVEDGWFVFETAERMLVGGLAVTSFSVPHDAADPVGYLFSDGKSSYFHATDMGVMTLPAKEALSKATCAVLESNHDPELLARSDRAESLKQRIRGRSGHLSNDQAADAVREVNPPKLRTLLLAHLSHQCNADYIAVETMQRALKDLGRADVTLAALSQDVPSALYEF